MIARSAIAYLAVLKKLLPRGRAWAAAPGSDMEKVLHGIADEAAAIDADIVATANQVIPDNAGDYLTWWESIAGLPEPFIIANEVVQSEADRLAALIEKLSRQADLSELGIIALAAAYGRVVTISYQTEYFTCTSACNDALYARNVWGLLFIVTVPGASYPLLEDVINERKPAHTTALFEYI